MIGRLLDRSARRQSKGTKSAKRLLRKRRRAQYASPHSSAMRESIGAALRELKDRGVAPEQVQDILNKLCIELVFTAHPTEAKRATALGCHRDSRDALRRR